MSITLLLLVAAFVTAVMSAAGKCPLWVAVILPCLVGLLTVLPR